MAVITYYPTYLIYLTDKAEVQSLQSQYPNGIAMAPDLAAAGFSAPIGGQTPGSAWTPPGIMLTTGLGSCLLPTSVLEGDLPASCMLPDTSPIPGWAPTSHTYRFIWNGYFMYAGPAEAAVGLTAIAQRRFIEGFQLPTNGEGGTLTGSAKSYVSRDASRTSDGYGLAFRGMNNSYLTHALNEYSGAYPASSWERLYLRLRLAPSAATSFWRCKTTLAPLGGCRLRVSPTGNLQVMRVANAGTETLLGTAPTALPLDTWVRVDLLLKWSTGAGVPGSVRVFFNGVSELSLVVAQDGNGLGIINGLHLSSLVGEDAAEANTLELDIADWINAAIPVDGGGNESFIGMDWLTGSHLRRIHARGGTHPDWVGNWRTAMQTPVAGALGTLVSTTALADLAITSDMTDQVELDGQRGVAAMVVSLYSSRAAVDGELGYVYPGGTVLTAISQNVIPAWNSVLYAPSGKYVPDPIAPLTLRHTKGNSGGTSTVYALTGVAEFLGQWGQEDCSPDDTYFSKSDPGVHNAPYVHTLLGNIRSGPDAAPLSHLVVLTGEYTGDDLGQDVLMTIPAHWWWARPLTGSTGGGHWWTSLLGAHRGLLEATRADALVDAWIESEQPRLAVTGATADVNATGVTYRWVAVCDPGHRICLNGAFAHKAALASAVNPLADTTFLPEAAFLLPEVIGGGATVRHWYKGIGHLGAAGSLLNAAEAASVAELMEGALTSYAALHVAGSGQAAYSLWRRQDPGGEVAVHIGAYTGDGAGGTRDIALALAGRSPCFALVVPHDAKAWCRDLSHTGADSSDALLTATSTTAIVGWGPDLLQVGTTLNTAGIIYDVFALPDMVGFYPWPYPLTPPLDIPGGGGPPYGCPMPETDIPASAPEGGCALPGAGDAW